MWFIFYEIQSYFTIAGTIQYQGTYPERPQLNYKAEFKQY